MNRICPKCKAVNPKVKQFSHTHDGSRCKNVIGKWYLFGFIPINKYCNSINDFDLDDDWIYESENLTNFKQNLNLI